VPADDPDAAPEAEAAPAPAPEAAPAAEAAAEAAARLQAAQPGPAPDIPTPVLDRMLAVGTPEYLADKLQAFHMLRRSFDSWSELLSAIQAFANTGSPVLESERRAVVQFLADPQQSALFLAPPGPSFLAGPSEDMDQLIIQGGGVQALFGHLSCFVALQRTCVTVSALAAMTRAAVSAGFHVAQRDAQAVNALLTGPACSLLPKAPSTSAEGSESAWPLVGPDLDNAFIACLRYVRNLPPGGGGTLPAVDALLALLNQFQSKGYRYENSKQLADMVAFTCTRTVSQKALGSRNPSQTTLGARNPSQTSRKRLL
jgi:hypothetical protein